MVISIETLSEMVASWAATEPVVEKAYLFGSRVRGDNRHDSDLDVAIEITTRRGDSGSLATWIAEAAQLRCSISLRIPFAVDLQWYGGPIETPVVHAGLIVGSRIVYERPAQQGAAGDAPQAARP
ncbi:nucleotidyltransferase domain-containing protein [Aromatoleum anaerobium]|uniref:Polymerase beta nucleotidyltransferase domain-containing protein n=1 Tax=Aromatoleum anaerobium TaxID=182180 RepID=A0ABX1PI79_9RHOO